MLDLDGIIFTVVGSDPSQRPTTTRSWDVAYRAMTEHEGWNECGGVFTCPETFRLGTDYVGGWLTSLTVYDSDGNEVGEACDLSVYEGLGEDCWGKYFQGEHDVFHNAHHHGWVLTLCRNGQWQHTHVVGDEPLGELLWKAIAIMIAPTDSATNNVVA